jgi:hypothetical protein
VVIATERFAELAQAAADGFGLSQARLATVPHPIGGTPAATLQSWGASAADEIMALLAR